MSNNEPDEEIDEDETKDKLEEQLSDLYDLEKPNLQESLLIDPDIKLKYKDGDLRINTSIKYYHIYLIEFFQRNKINHAVDKAHYTIRGPENCDWLVVFDVTKLIEALDKHLKTSELNQNNKIYSNNDLFFSKNQQKKPIKDSEPHDVHQNQLK